MYLAEFAVLATAHLLAVASPGPDFAIVLKHSITFGKRSAIYTSMGIGVAILLHVTYAIAGIGILVHTSPVLYNALIIVAAIFLLYLGGQAVRSPKTKFSVNNETEYSAISDKKSFALGFLTNGLNPKATVFFLSLFTVIVSHDTPMEVKALYGIYLAVATFIWFLGLSIFLSIRPIRERFTRYGYWFERLMGVILIIISVHLLYTEIYQKSFS